jgi:hypothetical protein
MGVGSCKNGGLPRAVQARRGRVLRRGVPRTLHGRTRHLPQEPPATSRVEPGPHAASSPLPAPLEGDLPAFSACSTSARAASGHGHLPGAVHARGATPIEASGVHALRRHGTACARRHGRGRCRGPALRGGRGW